MSENAKSAFMAMPRRAPLEMLAQDFDQHPVNNAPKQDRPETSLYWRLALFVPALVGTVLLMRGIYGWFSETGMAGLEWFLLSLIGLTFIWVSLSVSTIGIALAGLLARATDAQCAKGHAAPMDVALLMPIYNEATSDVFGNAAAMLDDLARQKTHHRYTLFILSDTRDAATAAREERAYSLLQVSAPAGMGVFYRRRAENTDKKVGNLVDWITGWGAAHDAMVVLDADSLMTGQAIDRLAYELSADPQAALIQTCPVLIGAETLFARLQQFSNIAYGWLMSEGLANWARGEGNYWGHNAIIRTRAFAACAGLPRLSRRGGRSDLIFSHDFVEAGLLRRAGWRVRFMPRLTGSFEETPGTLIDYVLRDQRWCRGNLQHLRLLGTAGLHPVSRFHLLHGAVSYLLSPAWFVLLIVWSSLGKDRDTNVISYFNEANPLFPDWPPAMSHIDSAVFLMIMYAMLLMPKLVGAGIIAAHPKATRLYGGRRAFLSAFGVEVFLSIAYAPILMIQQTRAVVRTAIGREMTWAAQNRTAVAYPLKDLLRFHWVETGVGIVLTMGLVSGLVSLWLIPIAASLLLAVPLSAASALPVARYLPEPLRMQSPLTLREPGIVQNARRKRRQLLTILDRPHQAAE